jgi:hypothetical protein
MARAWGHVQLPWASSVHNANATVSLFVQQPGAGLRPGNLAVNPPFLSALITSQGFTNNPFLVEAGFPVELNDLACSMRFSFEENRTRYSLQFNVQEIRQAR